VRDGAFAGAPTAITQTTDGYIWIGTFSALLRFDGVRFVPFAPPAGQHLPNPAVISVLGATDGSLWIGTASGLAQWRNGELFTFPVTAGRVNSIYEDRDGTIWITRSRTEAGSVCKVAASIATCYAPKDGVPPNANVLIKDNLGFFLIAHSTGIVRWKPGSSTSYELPGLMSAQGLNGISDLALASDGSVWVGTAGTGRGLGLKQWINGSWKAFTVPALDTSELLVNGLHLDRHNALWIATDGTGIYRVHDGNLDHFASADGLSSDSVDYTFEDREGNLWVTTTAGLDYFRDTPVVNFSEHERLTADKVGSILAARDGTIWIGNHGALDLVRGSVVSSISPKSGLRGNRVTSLFEDHAGRLWVGLDNGLLVYERGRFTPVHCPDGGPIGIVLSMTEDIDHDVWASVIRNPPGRPTKLICFRDGRFVREISDQRLDASSLTADPQGGFWLGLLRGGLARYRNDEAQLFPLKDASTRVNQVLSNSDGSVFAATTQGLVERRGDNQHTLDGKNGLPCNRIFALVTDKHSNLWLYAECGLIEIKSDDLQRWRDHPDQKVNYDLFDAFDGAQPFIPPFSPIATRSNDGRLWFANDTVAQMIDPDGLLRNPIPPPVHIEDVLADRKAYSPRSGLRLPALTRDLEIDYTALSFVVPQRVHFQYKLEGYDRDWQDAGTRRQAFYSNLRPRGYTFRVKACNNSGVWNEAGASLDFFVVAAYYQTNWFRFFCAAAFIALLLALHRWRVHRLTSQEKHLRDVVETIPAMTFTALSDGSCTFVNKRWTEYTGLSVEQSSGVGWQRAIHAEDLARNAEKWGRSIASGQFFEDEVRFRRAADGEYRWFLVRGVPLRDARGKIVRWYGTLTDIEDRKHAEEALQSISRDLQDSKTKLEEAQRIAHVGYWVWDLATSRLTWSDETYCIFGLRPRERSMDIKALLEMVHPEDRELMITVTQEAVRGEAGSDVEYRIIRPSGEVRAVFSRGDTKRDASGKPHERFGTIQDITDRKRAEEALQILSRDLQQSKAKLEEAQHITHVGYWERDLGTDRITWSDETYRIFGLQPQECPMDLAGLHQRIHPEDRDLVSQALDEALAGGVRYNIEYRVVRPTGELRIVHSTGDVKKNAYGQPYQMFGTVQDITDRKRAEEALQRTRLYLNEAQRLAHMGSWAFNAAGFDYWSAELFHVHGLDPNGKPPTIKEYLGLVHPEDRDSMQREIQEMLAEHREFDFTKRIVRPDGEIRHVRCVGVPVKNGSAFKGFFGTGVDVTEQELLRQELERRQRYLSEAQKLTHTGSWVLNVADRKLVHLSEEWYRIFGFDPAEGSPHWEKRIERIHPDDRLHWNSMLEQAIVEKTDYDGIFRIVLPEGTVRWIHTVGHPVLTAAGELVQFLGSSTDITEHKRAEEEHKKLRQLEAELAHINRVSMLGEMAASLAHEIKQPIAAAITSANTCVEWLAHEPPNLDRARVAATRVDKYGNRAAEIIDRIRAFYKKSSSQREPVDVNEIVLEIFTLLHGEAIRCSIAMRPELAAELPRVRADRVQLQQVFMNLTLNAIEAMRDEGGELTVRSYLQDDQVLFSVSDTGPGLPAGRVDQIFSAFFTTKPQGSGMGLAISRSIVESHGGRLWASANDGRGATFHFILPTEVQ
jgi:PAS domain S-box-containing protein